MPDWVAPPTRTVGWRFGLAFLLVLLDLTFSNIALTLITVSLQQCIIAVKPMVTIVIELLLFRRLEHPLVLATVVVVTVGAVLTTLGAEVASPWGFIAAVVALVTSACKYVATRVLVCDAHAPIHPVALLFWTDVCLSVVLALGAVANGEMGRFFDTICASRTAFVQGTGTALLGAPKALSQTILLVYLSATALSVSERASQVINVLLSLLLTQVHATLLPHTRSTSLVSTMQRH
jgi:hypothetical protein